MNLPNIAKAIELDPRVVRATVSKTKSSIINLTAKLPSSSDKVILKIEFGVSFPFAKPTVYLTDSSPPHLEHVNYAGEVCVLEDAGLSSNLNDPIAVARWWASAAIDVLERSLQKASASNFDELLNEFSGYWLPIGRHNVQLVSRLEGGPRFISGYEKGGRLMVVDCVSFNGRRNSKISGKLQKVCVAHIPLENVVLPPGRGTAVGVGYLRVILDKQPVALKETVKNLFRIMPKSNPNRYFLISQTAPDGMTNVVGITIRVRRNASDPIYGQGRIKKTIPWNVTHRYREYQVKRGGSGLDLSQKKVAIIGCGSLGGTLARLLAQSGIGTLHLVDGDSYSSDNVYRHTLPSQYVGINKAVALQSHLQEQFTGIRVIGTPKVLDRELEKSILASVDLVCLSTGCPDVERDLVRRHLQKRGIPPIISGWIEPLSLGGHVMLSENGRHGCLECNYGSSVEKPDTSSKVSFLAPGQNIQRTLMGCAGSFTPYSASDATQTASLMSRIAQERLLDSNREFYHYWRGNERFAISQGAIPSNWHKKSMSVESERIQDALRNKHCTVCGIWRE